MFRANILGRYKLLINSGLILFAQFSSVRNFLLLDGVDDELVKFANSLVAGWRVYCLFLKVFGLHR